MTVDDVLLDCEERMDKSAEFLRHEFQMIRTGKASAALVESIMVDYHGTHTRLRDLAGITVPEVRMIVIQPWDPSAIAAMEKAIQASPLGVTPHNDGRLLRIVLPELSEERRRELDRTVKRLAEEARVAVRNVRREANEHIRKIQKEEHISEDQRDAGLADVQEMTDRYIAEIEKILKHKEQEILTI